jgi:predicted TIM-barrel fold metal-dependent hydrolase
MRVVAIEEHHIVPEMRSRMDLSLLPPAFRGRLHATVGERLADMDAAGIDVQVLSVMLPVPRMLPAETAVPLVARINGELHGIVTAHPDRFAAFALLPVTVPDAAADELERAVSELGFAGAMISGTIGGRFLDDPVFAPVLETAARLNVPVYLHPGPPPQPVAEVYYAGFAAPVSQALATAGYGWHYETSLHALRMILGGVFDRLPGLKMILGHLGEGIAFHLPRIDDTLTPVAGHLAKPVEITTVTRPSPRDGAPDQGCRPASCWFPVDRPGAGRLPSHRSAAGRRPMVPEAIGRRRCWTPARGSCRAKDRLRRGSAESGQTRLTYEPGNDR